MAKYNIESNSAEKINEIDERGKEIEKYKLTIHYEKKYLWPSGHVAPAGTRFV